MNSKALRPAFALLAAALALLILGTSCGAKENTPGRMKVNGESLVLVGLQSSKLCFTDIAPGSVVLRSTYLPGKEKTITYEIGRDYMVDYNDGTIRRTAGSRIPDFGQNMLYGKKNFNQGDFPGYGNHAYFVWADYETKKGTPFAVETNQSALLPKTIAKLRAGGPFKLVAYGDSITAGGEASDVSLTFPNRYAETLKKRFPKAQITFENAATGGDTSFEGVARLESKLLNQKPDLVTVSFGMNDNNFSGVDIDKFEANLTAIIKSVRERTGAEVILISTFPPHPDWMFNSHRMAEYAAATKRVAAREKCAYADLYTTWTKVLERKDSSSLLGNNINHPNDFGHWLYLQSLEAVKF